MLSGGAGSRADAPAGLLLWRRCDSRLLGGGGRACWAAKTVVRGRTKCPSICSMPPVVAARPPRCRDSTPIAGHATRGRYPADPPTVGEIVAVMRAAGETIHGRPLRALIVVLWRAGLRIRRRSRS